MMKFVKVCALCFLTFLSISKGKDISSEHDFVTNRNRNLTKNSRFISFNNDESEIKVELEFAIPFLKIPVGQVKGSSGGPLSSPLQISTKGLITFAVMLYLFATVVPRLVGLLVPQAQSSTVETLLPIMGRLDDTLRQMDMSPSDCYQRSVCWLRSKADEEFIKDETIKPWFQRNTTNMYQNFDATMQGTRKSDCSIYKCSVSAPNLANIIKLGRSILE